jgi:hypothetical protein
MKLAELEKASNLCRERTEAQLRAQCSQEQASIVQQKEREKQYYQEHLQQIEDILKRFRAREVLEMVRDEVWKEGYISESAYNNGRLDLHPYGYSVSKTLSLISDPFPEVILDSQEGNSKAFLSEETTSFCLTARLECPYRNIGSTCTVLIEDHNLFHLDSSSQDAVKQGIRSLGLLRGWKKAVSAKRINDRTTKIIVSEGQEEEEKFLAFVLAQLDMRKKDKSSPVDIRIWANGLVDELPVLLRETRRLTLGELREWVHEIKGSNVIYRSADLLLNKVNIRLPL